METGVIFTCKYFKFGLNTTCPGQSHSRNFLACSIICLIVLLYADDTSITFAGSDVDEIKNYISLDLERIRVWLAAKFPIKQVSIVKSLGVHIDENLIWECHVNELSKNIASGIIAIKRIRHMIPYKTLLSIYSSLVQPYLDCCSLVWGSCSKSLSQKLQKSRNRAARVITFSNYDHSTDELLRMVIWVKLDRQRLVDHTSHQ